MCEREKCDRRDVCIIAKGEILFLVFVIWVSIRWMANECRIAGVYGVRV